MKSSDRIYQILLGWVHALCTLFQVVCAAWLYLRAKVEGRCHEFRGDRLGCVSSRFKGLKKVPQHLALILGPEEPSYKDLVNIIIWCTMCGIPYISFYDHNGILKRIEKSFFKRITELSGLKCKDDFWTKQEAPFNGYKNGFTRKIHITVLDRHSGRASIVDATKHFINIGVSSKDITIEYLDWVLKDRLGNLPDPELAIYCGDICSTYGFLPWQTRITEFVNLKSHHGVTVEEFIQVLQFYGKCEQRYGK